MAHACAREHPQKDTRMCAILLGHKRVHASAREHPNERYIDGTQACSHKHTRAPECTRCCWATSVVLHTFGSACQHFSIRSLKKVSEVWLRCGAFLMDRPRATLSITWLKMIDTGRTSGVGQSSGQIRVIVQIPAIASPHADQHTNDQRRSAQVAEKACVADRA
jgi:hypothetical protein